MIYTELDNPHAHLPKPKSEKELEFLLDYLVHNVSFSSITNWGDRVSHCLKNKDLLNWFSTYKGKFKIGNLGHKTYSINLDNLTTYIYFSQEIRTKEGPHITAECCDKPIEERNDFKKTIDLIHNYNGKTILEHPFTRDCPLMQYAYVFDSKYRNNIIESMSLVDGIEVFNSMNTWWQFLANLFAKDSGKKAAHKKGTYIPLLAGGDEHFNIKDIGRTGNLLPKEDLSQATGKEIQEWRWKQYKSENFKRKEQLTSLYTFYKFMMKPTIKRLLFKKERDFKDVFGKVI